MNNNKIEEELRQHPRYWAVHKKFWTKEFNNQDSKTSRKIIDNPECVEARRLNHRVLVQVKNEILAEV